MHPSLAAGVQAPMVELVLHDADGSPWPLVVSPEMVRFIGRYPRIDGIGGDAALLRFRPV